MKNDDKTKKIIDISDVRSVPPEKGGKGSPEATQRAKKTRSRVFKIIRPMIIGALVFTVAILIFINAENITSANIRRFFYTLDAGDSAGDGSIEFTGGDTDKYVSVKDGLAVVSTNGLVYISSKGVEELNIQASFTRPALSSGSKMLLAYDRGGKKLIVCDLKKKLAEIKYDFPVSTARMGQNGQFTVISDDDGYRACVTAYDTKQQEIYKWYSNEYYCVDAALSDDCRTLAVACVKESPTGVSSYLVLFDTLEDGPQNAVELGDGIAVSVNYLNGDSICVITDRELTLCNKKGEVQNKTDFENSKLRSFCFSDNRVSVLLTAAEAGSRFRIVSFGKNGEISADRSFNDEIDTVLVNSHGVVTLAGDCVAFYSDDLTRLKIFETNEQLDGAVLSDNGNVLVISDNTAEIIVR